MAVALGAFCTVGEVRSGWRNTADEQSPDVDAPFGAAPFGAVSIARRRGKFAPPGLLSLVCPHRGVQAYHARRNGEAHLVFGISSLHIKKCARTSQQLVSYRVAATVDREWPTLARTHARRSVSGASGARVNLIVFYLLQAFYPVVRSCGSA